MVQKVCKHVKYYEHFKLDIKRNWIKSKLFKYFIFGYPFFTPHHNPWESCPLYLTLTFMNSLIWKSCQTSTCTLKLMHLTITLQDTVVALQAMAEFASLIYSSKVNMSILIDDAVSTNRTLTVDADNMDVLQLVEVSSKTTCLQQ